MNVADDGVLTLREAIDAANAASGADSIQFQDGLAGVIQLRQGPLEVRDTVTIVGPGASVIGLDGTLLDPTPDRLNGDGQSAIVVVPRSTNPCAELHLSGLSVFNVDRVAIAGMWGSIAGVNFQANRGAIEQGLCLRPANDAAKWLNVTDSFFYQNVADDARQSRRDSSLTRRVDARLR